MQYIPTYATLKIAMEHTGEIIERRWKEFQSSPPRSGNGIYASISHTGVIVLNRKAFAALGEPKAISLLFDGDNCVIGLRPANPIMPNAFPLVPRGRCGNRIIRALAFAKEHQIEPDGTIRFLNAEVENGILILDLNKTARTTQTPRTGWRKRQKHDR